MDRKRLIWIIVGAVAVVVFVAAVITSAVRSSSSPEPSQSPGGGGIIDPNSGWEPGSTSSPTPTPTPTPEPNEAGNPGGGDALGHAGSFQDAEPAYKKAAEDFLTQYLQWDSNESSDARAARLAPFVDPGSTLLTKAPGISLVDKNPIYDYKSKTSLIGIDQRYTGWTLPNDARGNELYVGVVGNYRIEQQSSAGRQNSFWESSGRWTVEFAEWKGSPNLKVVAVREPAYVPSN